MELGNLASLTELWLDGNQLSGGIPPELDNLANLARLNLNDNQLSGCVPSNLSGQVSTIEISDLQFCP